MPLPGSSRARAKRMTIFCQACRTPCLAGETTSVDGETLCPSCAGDEYDGRYDVERRRLSSELKSKYRIPIEQYEMLFKAQAGRCAICTARPRGKNRGRLVVDHDHETGEVRGLLCHPCNVALGWMRDDPIVLRRAASYLESTPAAVLRQQLLTSAE